MAVILLFSGTLTGFCCLRKEKCVGTLSVINESPGVWKRDVGRIAPHLYNIRVRYHPDSTDDFTESLEYMIKGLDVRRYPTKGDARQAALYKLKIETPPCIKTEEQLQAQREYDTAWTHLTHALQLVENGVMSEGASDTNSNLDIATRRQNVKDAYHLCKLLGIHYAGEIE